MTHPTPEVDQLCVQTLRVLSIDAVEKANSGHPGLPLGAAPMAHALWSRFLKYDPTDPKWFDRDRFVLSAGHGSALLYSLLHLAGFDVTLDDLKAFRQLGSKTPGHPENHLTPGVEMATGPLGQGFSTAVGIAMAERFLAAKFNRPHFHIVDHFTYVLASDGDLMEGLSNEAASLAGTQKLGKLIVLYDDNRITIDGSTEIAFTEHVGARFAAQNWHVQHVDGMNVEAVAQAIHHAQTNDEQPSIIQCRTTIGFGSPNKGGSAKSHGAPLGPDELRLTKESLHIPSQEPFWRSPECLEFYRGRGEEGRHRHETWRGLITAYKAQHPELAEEFLSIVAGRVVDASLLPTFEGEIATRKSSQKAIQVLSEHFPTLVGGSADLAESNSTLIESSPYASAAKPDGRNIAFGVREHAMAAAVNGLNLHGGVRAFGATFLIFSDYCRPSIRLAALMACPSIFVFTHDSIGLGEDGPTHQPIEQLMSLRMIPNTLLFRPADGNETSACWSIAMETKDRPCLLALTRQNLPSLTTDDIAGHPARFGGYILGEPTKDPHLVLIGTGSELQLAVFAQSQLAKEGLRVWVVNMPCTQLFDMQTSEYRSSVLPAAVPALAIEAGGSFGWERYATATVGMTTFGASGKGEDVLRHFGFTVENVVAMARELAARAVVEV